ncbi:MAG: hypothetical protein ACOY71_05330 [Gemmatimonadota bacterium]
MNREYKAFLRKVAQIAEAVEQLKEDPIVNTAIDAALDDALEALEAVRETVRDELQVGA